MTVRVGLVGVGAIGIEHLERLVKRTAGVSVVGVADADAARARTAAERFGVAAAASGTELIGDPSVDAVAVATSGPAHEPLVLEAIRLGKPVFCEKPLAPTRAECARILAAEQARGRRQVQVGFMRRYDPGYVAMKSVIDAGEIGAPLMVHCAHRNPVVPPTFFGDMPITDAAIHEMDLVRWLLGQEVAAAVAVHRPRQTRHAAAGLDDPLILVMEMADGALVDVEVFVNAQYGYDIRCEVVGELGTVSLPRHPGVSLTRGLREEGDVPPNWQTRFRPAYDIEFQDWIDSIVAGDSRGASAWDGYAAIVVAEACIRTMATSQRSPVDLEPRPAFYA
jgi:myo-inositol 2-dehydrogenase/D-chiro-inositol 1-dehydrogenase